jgi:hypothetical protein
MSGPAPVSGLKRFRDRATARKMARDAAFLTWHHAAAIHYTQGPERWEGIARGLRAWRGQYPTEADCSAMATWWLWQGLGHFHLPDIVNGEDWRAGYTGTMLQHGRSVLDRGRRGWHVGDLVLYGSGWPGEHVAMFVDRGRYVMSHGSEAAPFLLPYDYRGDVLDVRRYI